MGRKRSFPITYLFPNIITVAGLCAGLSAIRFAMNDRFEMAVVMIIAAAIIDGMDGRLARMLNATSTFGAQLDSLADFVSFGVAPVFVMYLWQLDQIRGMGWIVVLFYSVCCALRLARFNTRAFQKELMQAGKGKPEEDNFFTGVPAPAGAMLCLLPLVLHFQFGAGLFDVPKLNAVYIPVIALLMASTIPTISAKKFKIQHSYALPVMVLSGLWIAGWIIEPWMTYSATAVMYLTLLPVGYYRYCDQQRTAEEEV